MYLHNVARTCFAATCLMVAICANSATFDCRDPSVSATEKRICSDPELSKLDNDLSAAYKSSDVDILNGYPVCPALFSWVDGLAKNRDACKDRLCIKTMYEARLKQISDIERISKSLAIPFTPCADGAETQYDSKAWPANPSQTITLIVNPTTASDKDDEDGPLYDFNLIVENSVTGTILRWEAKMRILYLSAIYIDTANYMIQHGRRAFGVRIVSDQSGNPSVDSEALYLFDFQNLSMPQVLSMPTAWDSGATGTDEACFSDHGYQSISIGKAITNGYFDLMVTEKMTHSEDRTSRYAKVGDCSVTHHLKKYTLHFDGTKYSVPTAPNSFYHDNESLFPPIKNFKWTLRSRQ